MLKNKNFSLNLKKKVLPCQVLKKIEIATVATDSVADTEHELHHMRVIRDRYLS